MTTIIKILAITLLADFVTGFVHWLEDSYWTINTPVLGKWIVAPNLEHHQNGQAFLKKTWLESSWDLVLAGSLIIAGAYLLNRLTWELGLFTFIIMNANQVHKWAHITNYQKKPYLIGLLQKLYVLQRTDHHGQHHRKPNDSHYCVITNILNPLLDGAGFWRGLELLFKKTTVRA
tara:strand:+ start:572 stop:1096 length:525 start_codon:yes stop_codon:yes gene_type:complete